MSIIKRVLSLLVCILFISCSSHKTFIAKDQNFKNDFLQVMLEQTKGNGNIKLLPHQLRPIDYLSKNPHIKGLLVNHYMGTGKTYLGIGFAETIPNKPVIILAPKFLKSHWFNELNKFGVSNINRFEFISYDDAIELIDRDLKGTIVIADEVHNLIKNMHTVDPVANQKYTRAYLSIRKADRILGLSGTPIYGDESDLALLINLVSGEDVLPFNKEEFRLNYTKIKKTRQFFRGYLTESNLVTYSLPMFSTLFGIAAFGLPGLIVAPISIATVVGVNQFLPVSTFKLREFDLEKMRPILHKYVSYFRFSESNLTNFPSLKTDIIKVPYSNEQFSFFLHMIDGDLPPHHLKRLVKNNYDDDFIKINSTEFHKQAISTIGVGRDIGNYHFLSEDEKIIESPKFKKLLSELKQNDEKSLIYSNYYDNGILYFKDFLERNNYDKGFGIIHPDLKPEEVKIIVESFNTGSIQLLMLHPSITEGISLIGCRYVYFLEPTLNNTDFEQVVGRARRLNSHNHLPKEKQVVEVKILISDSAGWFSSNANIKRANWYKRFRELSNMSYWGVGVSQVDPKLDLKILNPEEAAQLKMETLTKSLYEIQKILSIESIETLYLGN